MRALSSTVMVSQVVAIALVLAVPSRSFADATPSRLIRPAVSAAAIRTRSPFDAESLRHAVETALRAPAPAAQRVAPVAAGRDSLWNGVLIGAGIGAVLGGVAGARGECSTGVSSDCDLLAPAAVGTGIVIGGLMGAGIGAVVDLLIR